MTKSSRFVTAHKAACHCNWRVPPAAIANPDASQPVQFACRVTSFEDTRALVRQVGEARWASEVHRSSQPRASSVDFAHRLMEAFDRAKESTSES